MSIIVAYSPDVYGRAALDHGVAEALLRQTRLVVVNATRGDSLVDTHYAHEDEMQELETRLRAEGVELTVHRDVVPDIADAVLDVARRGGRHAHRGRRPAPHARGQDAARQRGPAGHPRRQLPGAGREARHGVGLARLADFGGGPTVGSMDYRSLGRTGMQVSPLCLGAMMFGQWGEPDHDTSIGIIHRALDAGINFVDTADVYSQGESEEIVGKALKGRRDDVILATKFHGPMDVPMGEPGRRPQPAGQLAPLDHPGGREQPAPARHRLDRPLPGAPPGAGHRRRGDPLGADRPAAPGQDPRVRLLDVPRPRGRRGPVGRRATRPRPVRDRAAAVLHPGARHRGRPAPGRPSSSGWASSRGARSPAAG